MQLQLEDVKRFKKLKSCCCNQIYRLRHCLLIMSNGLINAETIPRSTIRSNMVDPVKQSTLAKNNMIPGVVCFFAIKKTTKV